MRQCTAWIAILVTVGLAGAGDLGVLGGSEETVLIPFAGEDCIGGRVANHDGTFEGGYCWQFGGVVPPYYGAYAEGFEGMGSVGVECGIYWFSQVGYFAGAPMDAYVWEGGFCTEPPGPYNPPGAVLCVVPGVVPTNIPLWPEVGENQVEFGCCSVGSDFAVGYWADFSQDICEWFIMGDDNGFGGCPWTCIAPGIGYPTGWQSIALIFPGCLSLGIEATILEEPSPAESQTWGSLKALFE